MAGSHSRPTGAQNQIALGATRLAEGLRHPSGGSAWPLQGLREVLILRTQLLTDRSAGEAAVPDSLKWDSLAFLIFELI